MAETKAVPGKRSFLFIFLVSIVTFGIYWLYWYYKTNDEMKEYGKMDNSPMMRLLVLVFGIILLGIPSLYIYYVWLRDANDLAKKNGLPGFSPIVHVILAFIPLGTLYSTYKVQATLNDVWDRMAAGETRTGKGSETVQSSSTDAEPKEKVVVICPRCKSRNKEDSNYCIKCGEKIQA